MTHFVSKEVATESRLGKVILKKPQRTALRYPGFINFHFVPSCKSEYEIFVSGLTYPRVLEETKNSKGNSNNKQLILT